MSLHPRSAEQLDVRFAAIILRDLQQQQEVPFSGPGNPIVDRKIRAIKALLELTLWHRVCNVDVVSAVLAPLNLFLAQKPAWVSAELEELANHDDDWSTAAFQARVTRMEELLDTVATPWHPVASAILHLFNVSGSLEGLALQTFRKLAAPISRGGHGIQFCEYDEETGTMTLAPDHIAVNYLLQRLEIGEVRRANPNNNDDDGNEEAAEDDHMLLFDAGDIGSLR